MTPLRSPAPAHATGWFRRRLARVDHLGRASIGLLRTARGIIAFALLTLGAALLHRRAAARVIRPLVRVEIRRVGLRLLPMAAFVALGLGFVVVGQTIELLSRVGAQDYVGTVMVTVVVRELGPLAIALLVLARAGTAQVIELGTSRALGELEALEALAIDPVHYLVVPRVVGMAVAVSALTVYFLLVSLTGGLVYAFLQNLAITPGEYVRQLARALQWQDFVLLALKTLGYGSLVAAITCYHGLARPLRIEELPTATSRAVVQSVVACLSVDLTVIAIQWVL